MLQYGTKIFPRTKILQMTVLQTHMLNINKTSVSKGTLDAILLRLAHSAIFHQNKKIKKKKKKKKKKKDLEKCSIAHTVWALCLSFTFL